MRILLLYDGIYPDRFGGVERRNFALAREMTARGHSVTLAGFVADPSAIPRDLRVLDLGKPTVLYNKRGHRRFSHTARYASAAARIPIEGFDILETASLPLSHLPMLQIRARRAGIPLVVTWHEYWGNFWSVQFPRWSSIFAPLERWAARRCGNTVVSVSRLTAERVRKATGRDVAIVPNGIPAAQILETASRTSPGPPLLFVGRLIADKRVDLLIRAVAAVEKDFPSPLLTIVGGGPELESLQRLAQTLRIEGSIVWAGELPAERDVWRAMGACRIFVNPSAREGFGIAALEAMAARRPVICCESPDSALPELVTDGMNGRCVPANAEALAESIRALMADESSGRTLADQALATAEGFDWSRVAASFERVLEMTLEHHRATGKSGRSLP